MQQVYLLIALVSKKIKKGVFLLTLQLISLELSLWNPKKNKDPQQRRRKTISVSEREQC